MYSISAGFTMDSITSTDTAFCNYYDDTRQVGFCLGTQDAFFKTNKATLNANYVEDKIVNLETFKEDELEKEDVVKGNGANSVLNEDNAKQNAVATIDMEDLLNTLTSMLDEGDSDFELSIIEENIKQILMNRRILSMRGLYRLSVKTKLPQIEKQPYRQIK